MCLGQHCRDASKCAQVMRTVVGTRAIRAPAGSRVAVAARVATLVGAVARLVAARGASARGAVSARGPCAVDTEGKVGRVALQQHVSALQQQQHAR